MGWQKWNGKKLTQDAEDAFSKGIKSALEAIGAESDQQVPLDEGTLQNSKTVIVEGLNGSIGYGGGPGTGFPKIPYAQKWHEVPANFQHGRKHNYLRDPVKANGKDYMKRELTKAAKEVWT